MLQSESYPYEGTSEYPNVVVGNSQNGVGIHIPDAIISEDTPVFNGPIYNLESYDNLPAPAHSTQKVELVEGDPDDPFSSRTYRIVTTHILPSVYVYTPPEGEEMNETNRGLDAPNIADISEQHLQPIGELFVDLTSPASLAPWLVLLDAHAPIVFHDVDPRANDYSSKGNMQGRIPMWIDSDTTCLWESNAIMKYVCDKHQLNPHLYPTDLALRTRTNIALDWCSSVLYPHVNHIIDVDSVAGKEDADSMATSLFNLDKDQRVVTDYFLRETPFIGGFQPNIADYAISMHLLLLYAAEQAPHLKIRKYLKAMATISKNWNEVTAVLRDYCGRRRQEYRRRQAQFDRQAIDEERERFMMETESHQLETERRRRAVEDQFRKKIEEEAHRRNEENIKRTEDESKDRQTEWDKRKRQADEGRQRELIDLKRRLEEEKRGIEEDRKRRIEDEKKWRASCERRIRDEEDEKLAYRRSEEERLRREQEEKRLEAERAKREQEEAAQREREEREREAEEERRKKEEEENRRREEEEERRRKLEEERKKKEDSQNRLTGKKAPAGPPPKPYVGVMVKMLDDEQGNKDCVVVVEEVPNGTPAHNAGIMVDDIIKAWNGSNLNSKAQWEDKVKTSKVGDTVTIQVVRKGTPQDIKLTVGTTNKELVSKTVKSSTAVGKK